MPYSRGRAAGAPGADELAGGLEPLEPLVPRVGHPHVTGLVVDVDIARLTELARGGRLGGTREEAGVVAVRGEPVHAGVAVLRDVQRAVGSDRRLAGAPQVEQTRSGSGSQGLEELALQVVDPDLPHRRVGHVDPVPGVVDRHAPRVAVELAVAVDADRGPGRVVLQDPVVERVGQPEVARCVHVDAVDARHVAAGRAAGPDVERLGVLAVREPPHPHLRPVGRVVGVVAVGLDQVAGAVDGDPRLVVDAAQGQRLHEGAVLGVLRHLVAGLPVGDLRDVDVTVARVHADGVRLARRVGPVEGSEDLAVGAVPADLVVEVVPDDDLVAHRVVLHSPGEDPGTSVAADGADKRWCGPGRLGGRRRQLQQGEPAVHQDGGHHGSTDSSEVHRGSPQP